MALTLHACVVLGGKVEHAQLTFESSGLTTLRALLDHADREALGGRGFFDGLLQEGADWITVLHNGRRLALPEGLEVSLADGDQVSVLTPLVGG